MVQLSMYCKICGLKTEFFGNTKILKKYLVNFYHCNNCGFLQTEEPYWLDQSYTSAITKSDIGLISRNLSLAEKTKEFILRCVNPQLCFVDYGGGYGLFTRLMRDKGFDFYHFDPFCENIFAVGFEATLEHKYSLLTAWEVFEHMINPLDEVEKMLDFGSLILFSTMTISNQLKPLDKWWYYGTEHGQHISFYSEKTLSFIANKYKLSLLYSDGNIHLIGDASINKYRIFLSLSERFRLFRKIVKKPQPPSLIKSDFKKTTGIELL